MGSNDNFKNRRGIKKSRKENSRELKSYRYLIICEGEETEPNYFKGIKKLIDEKYKNERNEIVKIEIKGIGRSHEVLVEHSLKLLNKSTLYSPENFWIIFDRDEDDDQFDRAIKKAETNNMNVACSNDSIELWFLLHFQYIESAIHRDDYILKLNGHFKQLKLEKYQKNMTNIFDILKGKTSIAITNAKKLEELHKYKTLNSSKNPCTKVYELVEMLMSI